VEDINLIRTADPMSMGIQKKKYLYKVALIKQAEFVFLSFPKCGRTWVKYFLAHYFAVALRQSFSLEFDSTNPKIHFTHDFFSWYQDVVEPVRLLGSQYYREKKLILLVRDPRDAVVSYYHHKVRRDKANVNLDIDSFCLSELYGIERQSEFVIKALEFYDKHKGPKILLAYEDVKCDARTEFHLLVDFIFGTVDPHAFNHALRESSFENMRDYETSNNHSDALDLKYWDGGVNSLKTRKGKVGSYLDELRQETISVMESLPFTHQLLNRLNLE